MNNPTMNIEALRAFFARTAVKRAIVAVIAWRIKAKVTREYVDAYCLPILADLQIPDKRTGEQIDDLEHVYKADLDSHEIKRFYELCNDAHRAHGFDVPPGYCPALVAEHEVVKNEHALLSLAKQFLGIDAISAKLEHRETLLNLLLNPSKATT